MHHYAKHFTLEEARRTLQEILPALNDIQRFKKALDEKNYDVYRHQYFGGIGPNGQKVFPEEMERLVVLVRNLHECGVEIKDLNTGLIDFPSLRKDGEEVFLCYQLGEPDIIAWHTIQGGFAGRHPISEL